MSEDSKLPLSTTDALTDLVEQLRRAAPAFFTEGKLDPDKLREALGERVAKGLERYGLNWAGKRDAFQLVRSASVGTLLPMRKDSVDWDSTGNAIVEGDNLEVLKLLQKAYHGRVKTIYIDPPYNTGNDFLYEDDFRDGLTRYPRYSGQVSDEGVRQTTNTETTGRFHSRWLSMMYPRLFLARNLLREDGVIFVSVDDNEVHNLRLLMDEVFGEENRVESFVWKKSYGGGAKERYAVTQHEYVLMYSRNLNSIDALRLPPDKEAEGKYYKYKDEKLAQRGPYRLKPLEATRSMDKRENLVYAIPSPAGTEVWPKKQWWWKKKRALRALASNELVFTKNSEGYSISYKQYLRDEDGSERGAKPFSIIDGIFTQSGTADLAACFEGVSPLQFPKPVELIKRLIAIGDTGSSDGIVLDLFAGSGTTGQAVYEMNKEFGGTRRFILVQLPEPTGAIDLPTIATITRERVKRAGHRIFGSGKEVGDYGFRAYRFSSSNFNPTRSPEDVLHELILKSGYPLSVSVRKTAVGGGAVYSVANGELLVTLDHPVTGALIRAMVELRPRQVLCLDVAFDGNDALKTNSVLEARARGVTFRTA